MCILTTEKTLEDVLRHDGNYDLSKRLIPASTSQENVEKKINERRQQAKPNVARKSDH